MVYLLFKMGFNGITYRLAACLYEEHSMQAIKKRAAIVGNHPVDLLSHGIQTLKICPSGIVLQYSELFPSMEIVKFIGVIMMRFSRINLSLSLKEHADSSPEDVDDIKESVIFELHTLHSFTVQKIEGTDQIEISVSFKNREGNSEWEAVLTSRFEEMGQSECSMKKSKKRIGVRTSAKNLKNIIEHLSPIAESTQFQLVHFSRVEEEIVRLFVNFFVPESILQLMITPAFNVDFEHWLELIDRLRPSLVNFYRDQQVTPEMKEFLLGLADRVRNIWIEEYADPDDYLDVMPLKLIRTMLSRVCDHLQMNGRCHELELADVVRMTDDFEQGSKKVSLILPVRTRLMRDEFGAFLMDQDEKKSTLRTSKHSVRPMRAKIGEYIVQTVHSRKLMIAHRDTVFNPK